MSILKKLHSTIKRLFPAYQETETKSYMSEESSQIYYLLCQALEGRFVIVPKVALHDIVEPLNAGPNYMFDFGVFTPKFEIVAVVTSQARSETHVLSDIGVITVNINQPEQADWHIESLRCTLAGSNHYDIGWASVH